MADTTTTKPPRVRKAPTAVKATSPEPEPVEEPQSPGAAVVPDKDVVDAYVHRDISPGVTDFDILDFARAQKINVLAEGPTGCGKTMCARAYAAARGLRFFAMSSNVGVDPSQLFGRMIPTEDGHFMWQDGPVTEMLRYGGVLVVDEINFLPERVSTVLFPVLDARRSTNLVDHKNELVVAHDDLIIVAGMNPGYAGTRTLNAALRNRFAIQMQWDYDRAQEEQLIKSATLLTISQQLRQTGEVRTPVSTNMLQELEKFATSTLGADFAVANFVAHFDAQSEQTFVASFFDTHRDALVRELNGGIEEDEDEWDPDDWDLTVNGTPDDPNPIQHPDWVPSMGIYVGDRAAYVPDPTVNMGTWDLQDDVQYEGNEEGPF